jgi:hypothetical protein
MSVESAVSIGSSIVQIFMSNENSIRKQEKISNFSTFPILFQILPSKKLFHKTWCYMDAYTGMFIIEY